MWNERSLTENQILFKSPYFKYAEYENPETENNF